MYTCRYPFFNNIRTPSTGPIFPITVRTPLDEWNLRNSFWMVSCGWIVAVDLEDLWDLKERRERERLIEWGGEFEVGRDRKR